VRDVYNDILVPTDGSQSAKAALEHGIEIASKWDATLHTLYVVDTRLERSGPSLETLRDEGRKAVQDVDIAGTRGGLSVVTELVEGNPHEEILDYVTEHGMDMIIVGTHGRTGLDRVVMGSVAERVVRRSPVPVLTVRGGEQD
jgi:nucleotide-binding universal stress UspA family protein